MQTILAKERYRNGARDWKWLRRWKRVQNEIDCGGYWSWGESVLDTRFLFNHDAICPTQMSIGIILFIFNFRPSQHQIPTAAYAECVKAANLCAFQFSLIEWTLSRHLQPKQSHWMRITCSIAVTTQLFRFVSRTEPKGELWVSFVSRGTWCVVMSSIRWNFRNYVCGVGATNWRERCGRIKTKRKLHSQCTRKRIAFNHILPFKLWSRRVGLGLAHGTRYAHSNKHQII